jgi:hypothetical protein
MILCDGESDVFFFYGESDVLEHYYGIMELVFTVVTAAARNESRTQSFETC